MQKEWLATQPYSTAEEGCASGNSEAYCAVPSRNGGLRSANPPYGLTEIHSVIPGRAKREHGIHKHDGEYGFRACAKWRIHDVQLHIGE